MSNEANIELQALVRELLALWSGKTSAITCAEDAYKRCRVAVEKQKEMEEL
jgi:hypothetical protein